MFNRQRDGSPRQKNITKIVLTGGPCAGKTTASSWIAEEFTKRGYHVMFVPESATELIVGGIRPWDLSTEEFQSINLENQLMKERLFTRAAESHPSDKVLIVCDRGIMDNAAYMGTCQFDALLLSMGLSRILLRDSYDAVFHLVTAADGAEQAYTLGNNSARTETPDEARAVDKRLLAAWTGHPHLRVIGNEGTFEDKMRSVVAEVAGVLGEPEPREIERKFLIKMPSDEWFESMDGHESVDILQTYLACDEPSTERRVRQRGRDGNYVYTLTTKAEVGVGESTTRVEIERMIGEQEYVTLLMEADRRRVPVRKTRHLVMSDGQYFEIDAYPFDDEFAIMEIELLREGDEVRIPDGLKVVREVTDDNRYRNSSLALRQRESLLAEEDSNASVA